MVLCAIWSYGRSELVECQGNITSVIYVSILQEGLLPIYSSDGVVKNKSIFMEDVAPGVTAKNTPDCQF